MTTLDGKVAIVTGSGRGIGRAEALALAQAGARVVINDIGAAVSGDGVETDVAQAVVEEIKAFGGEAVANTSDISTWDGGRQVVAAAIAAFGQLDILVNNAGNARPARIDEMSEETWNRVLGVHLTGHVGTIRHAAPVFRDQGHGVIVNTGSTSGLGHYGMANYAAAKEAILGLTYTVARDLGQFGVRCNAIRPVGATRLGIPELIETVIYSQDVLGIPASGPMWVADGDLDPAYVGMFVSWLCSDAASEVNGRVFFVAGGKVGLYPLPEVERSMYKEGGWTIDALNEPGARDYLIGDLRNEYTGKKN